MSIFDSNNVEIKVFYTYKKKNNSELLFVLSDEQVEKMMKNADTEKQVFCLTTEWSLLTWSEQNNAVNLAYQNLNPKGERFFDHVAYRDAIIKAGLKKWDAKVNDQIVPVTPEAIDKLPSDLVISLYSKYEKFLYYTDEELGN